jgi:ribonuclease P protein component
MRKSLTRKERLRGTFALKRVFSVSRNVGSGCEGERKTARTASGPGARLVLTENGLEYNRIVVSPVRKFGGAVARNRARRVGKEAYRCIKSSIKPGFDLAFILFPGDYSYGERIAQFSFLLKKAGLLCKD